MRAIAAEGYLVVVPEMPFNIAAFRPNAASAIIDHYPSIESWSIGGHSVGAVMAAQYTSKNSDVIDGLALWAGYPAGNADISSFDQDVTLIYGSLDPQATEEGVEQRRHLLPADTTYVRIEGGDHHQFGSYEIEPEDHHATIDRQSQHEQILTATLALLAEASGDRMSVATGIERVRDSSQHGWQGMPSHRCHLGDRQSHGVCPGCPGCTSSHRRQEPRQDGRNGSVDQV